MKILLFAFVTALQLVTAHAHEGHDKSPGAVAAPHGGMIQGTGELYVEVLQKSGAVEIFVYDHDLKPLPPKEAKVSGQVTLPKKPKGEAVKLEMQPDRFSTKIDAKGSHRFELGLTIVHREKTEKIKFNIEPQ